MKPDEQPCEQDCPGRSETCHATCREYLEFYVSQREREAERQDEARLNDYVAAAYKRCRVGLSMNRKKRR